MKILIVEDDLLAVSRLETILSKIDENINILQVCKTVKDTISWLKNNTQPNLMFLDIQLSDGVSFEIFKSVEITCPIVFITAFDNYAIEAFKVNSIDYILKPYSLDDVKNALLKYKNLQKNEIFTFNKSLFDELIQSIPLNYKSRFFSTINHTIYSIPIEEILYFNFEDGATTLVNINNKIFVLNYSLEALEKYLDPNLFFRINRKFIIKIDSIKKMNLLSKSRIQVVLNNNVKEVVSRSKSRSFKTWLNL
jgi:DNA-binding LytR/AlgR family response regulator